MPLTKNPLRILVGVISVVFGFSAFFRMMHGEAGKKFYKPGQHLVMYNWAAENCNNKLNISEIDNIDDFQTGCYHFVGHLRIEGNFSVPPLVDTTQCPGLMAAQYVQNYGTFLAKQCNFNGQNSECSDFNPACQVDTETGLGYEVRHGWVPSISTVSEFYHGYSEDYEWEDWLAQTDEWKEAAARNRMSMFQLNYDRCSVLGEGGTSICSHDFETPNAHFMNNSRVCAWTDEVMHGSGYEMGGFWSFNDPENLPIYDVGKGPGTTAIHFNAFRAIEDGINGNRAELEAMTAAKYPGRSLVNYNPIMVPAESDTDLVGYKNYRDLEIVMRQRHQMYYVGMFLKTLLHMNSILDTYREQEQFQEGRWFSPVPHQYGPIIHAPNALGDSFYADADMEEARLNGTTRSSPIFEWRDNKVQMFPFAFGPEMWTKMRANGGEFTDAEFKALPEYGDPEHFPLVANETRWEGGNNCWHDECDMYTPLHPKNTRKFTPVCRMEEPTDLPLEFIGMVHKKINAKTGQPMLAYNSIAFSENIYNNVTNDMSKIESAAKINKLPDNIPRWSERAAEMYPDYWVLCWLADMSIRGMQFYGKSWYHNGLSKSKFGKVLMYYITWINPNDVHLIQFGIYDEQYPIFDDIKIKAQFAVTEFRNSWYVLYSMAVVFWAITAMIVTWEVKSKRSSEES